MSAADVKAYKSFQLLYLFIDPDHYDLDEAGRDLRGALLKMTHTIMLKAIAKYCYIFTEKFVEVMAQFAPIPIQARLHLPPPQTLHAHLFETKFSHASFSGNAAFAKGEQHGPYAADGEEQPDLRREGEREGEREGQSLTNEQPSFTTPRGYFIYFSVLKVSFRSCGLASSPMMA
jgi:hypothetical protein